MRITVYDIVVKLKDAFYSSQNSRTVTYNHRLLNNQIRKRTFFTAFTFLTTLYFQIKLTNSRLFQMRYGDSINDSVIDIINLIILS